MPQKSAGKPGEIQDRLALHQESESHLDRVSTGSGSDLVSDQHARFPGDFDSHS